MENRSEIAIRFANPSDLAEMQKLFVDTISAICKDDYSPQQIKAWISSAENTQRWTDKLSSQYFLVAESDNTIVGYASLANGDYLDILYVHKEYQRQGIAGKLFAEIEKEAIRQKVKTLYSDVSETAKPFFQKMGFTIIQPQMHIIQNTEIINYKMKKQL